jgi:membrane peptidoglycan carboxypeptidase
MGFLKKFGRSVWFLLRSLVIAATAVAVPVIAVAVAIATLVLTPLPGPTPEARPIFLSRPSTLYDTQGNPIGELRAFDEAKPTEPEDVNVNIVEALVAAEDRRFFEHNGVDPVGIARAARENFESGSTTQGGSTITQQLVKNRYLGGERTFARKIREAVFAQRLEQEFSKEEIMHQYLSSVYFGSGAYGLSSAAEIYFRKDAKDLNASEAATLVGTLPSPTQNSPHVNPLNAEAARVRTLESMHDAGYLTREEADAAIQERLVGVNQFGVAPEGTPANYTKIYPRPENNYGFTPTFTTYVMDYLVEKYGPKTVFEGGLRVETTLNPEYQAAAEAAVDRAIEGAADDSTTAAMASIDPKTGFITAMADTGQWTQTQVNYAAGGSTGYQPGSSFKPFAIVAAMEQGVSPDSTISYGGSYTASTGEVLRNYGGEGGGSTTIRNATRVSLNIPFLILADRVGPGAVAEVANRAGIKRLTPDRSYGVSIALGAYEVSPLDMASAYATFANRGLYMSPVPVVRVLNADGVIVEDNTVRAGVQVFDPVVMDNLNSVLQGVVEGGTGTSAKTPGRPVAGKTGTAENYTAAWFAGFTPNLSAAFWLGHSDGTRPLRIYGNGEIVGGGPPARAWKQFTDTAFQTLPVEGFVPPGPLPPPRSVALTPEGQPAPPEATTPTAPPPPPQPTVNAVRQENERTQTPR